MHEIKLDGGGGFSYGLDTSGTKILRTARLQKNSKGHGTDIYRIYLQNNITSSRSQ